MKFTPLVIVVLCVCGALGAAQDDEPRPAPSRGLLKRGLLAKGKGTTTTTTTQAPQEEADYEYENEEVAEGDQQVSSTEAPSSTEGKKLVAGGVRPFRSNADLLETLKRRRAQVAEAKNHGSTTPVAQEIQSATEAPAKSSYSNKKRGYAAVRESNSEDSPAAAASKPSRGRFGGRPQSKSYQEEPEEVQDAPAAPAAPARASRTFNRRGN